jgi:hypothetical protein
MNITWIIEKLTCKPTVDGLQNVIVSADWRVNGSQDGIFGTCYGSVPFEAANPNDFIAYENLTLDKALQWVKELLGTDQVAAIEANVAQQIADQVNPPTITPPLPWLPVPEVPMTPQEDSVVPTEPEVVEEPVVQ